jgi:hypothetical protein
VPASRAVVGLTDRIFTRLAPPAAQQQQQQREAVRAGVSSFSSDVTQVVKVQCGLCDVLAAGFTQYSRKLATGWC